VSDAVQGRAAALKAHSPWAEAWGVFRQNKAALFGLGLLVVLTLVVIVGPFVYSVDPFEIVQAPHMPPGSEDVPFGSDYLGRDILAGLIHGGRPTLLVGALAAAIAALIGITIGALSGFFGGRVDGILGRVTEFFQVLPALLFAMVLITLFGPRLLTVAIAIGVVAWTAMARLTRAEFLRIKQLDFVRSARSIGASNVRIMLRTILPNALPPIIVAGTLAAGSAILAEASLSFLGLSDRNVMSWGLMIGSSRLYLREAWWAVTFPGLAIFLTVLAISLVGDGLNDAFNPKLRSR
jgi:peptide/nickel transport system permease protein